MEIKSSFCNTIIPSAALISQDEVYIIKERSSFWGEELYVVKQKVVTGLSDNYKTEIKDGLRRTDLVVTGWDRQLTDGAAVMAPLDK